MLSIIQNGPYVLGNDSQVQAGVPQGELNRFKMTSKIYPGAVQDYWIYVPAGYGDKNFFVAQKNPITGSDWILRMAEPRALIMHG
jgi:hypothetical protein